MNSYMQKNQTGLVSHIIYKNKINMDYRPKCKTETIELLEEKLGRRTFKMAEK